jgi:hypothetical protein
MAGMMGRPADPAVATTRQALAAMAEAFDGEGGTLATVCLMHALLQRMQVHDAVGIAVCC